jgi:hypothetical protein
MAEKHHDPGSPDVDTGHATGPTSIQGVEASEFPDERGSVDTDPRRINARKTPAQTGENSTGDIGLRGTPDIAEAADHGHRKRN